MKKYRLRWGREAIEVDEQRTTSVLTNGVLGGKKLSMFRTDQVISLLTIFFQRLMGWGLGDLRIVFPKQSLKPVLVDHGSRLYGFDAQSRADVEWMTTRLDPIPFGCEASDTAHRRGNSASAPRPVPSGWA